MTTGRINQIAILQVALGGPGRGAQELFPPVHLTLPKKRKVSLRIRFFLSKEEDSKVTLMSRRTPVLPAPRPPLGRQERVVLRCVQSCFGYYLFSSSL